MQKSTFFPFVRHYFLLVQHFFLFLLWRKNVQWYEMALKTATKTFDIFSFLKFEFNIFSIFNLEFDIFSFFKFYNKNIELYNIFSTFSTFFPWPRKKEKCWFNFFAIRHFFPITILKSQFSKIWHFSDFFYRCSENC